MKDVNDAYRLGANSFLMKPYDFADLVRFGNFIRDFWLNFSKCPESFRPSKTHLPTRPAPTKVKARLLSGVIALMSYFLDIPFQWLIGMKIYPSPFFVTVSQAPKTIALNLDGDDVPPIFTSQATQWFIALRSHACKLPIFKRMSNGK
jgi:hypothetical protein